MKKKNVIICLIIMLLIALTSVAFAADPKVAEANAQKFGIWTITPPFVAIVLAFITKNVILSLFLGVYSGAILLNLHSGFFSAFINAYQSVITFVLKSLSDSWNAGIVLQVLTIGGLIALISKMGGARAVAEALAKKASTARSAQIITWFLGLFVFFDDYANSLIVGPIMRPVTDKFRISREKLSFIIDATAAPIAGIALISTWVGYELSLIKDAFNTIGQNVNAYGIFIETIPYRFYNILILALIVFSAVLLKDVGPMLKAERRARSTGKVLADGAKPLTSEEATELEPENSTKLCIWNAIVPIGVLLLASFIGFYTNGYDSIMGGKDKELIGLLTNSPYSFTALREAFGASDASIVLFQAALLASVVAIGMGMSQ